MDSEVYFLAIYANIKHNFLMMAIKMAKINENITVTTQVG